MMSFVSFTLRLDILREALDQYKALEKAAQATSAERQLYALKALECEAMIKEMMGGNNK